MKPAKLHLTIILIILSSTCCLSYDYETAQAKANREYGRCLYFPLSQYKPTNCGFYGYRAPTGNWHGANDFTGQIGEPVYAAHDGIVIIATNGSGNTYPNIYTGGNQVGIKYRNLAFGCCHLERSLVKVGQVVHLGDLIGRLGNTGYSTGPHVHFWVRYLGDESHLGTPVDPYKGLWRDGPPVTPACQANIARETEQAIKRAANVLDDILPLKPTIVKNSPNNQFRVVSCNIKDGDTGVRPDALVYIRFSKPVDCNQVRGLARLQPTLFVPGGVIDYPYPEDKTLVRMWGEMFNANQRYTFSINGLRSLAGDNLGSWQVSFKTGSWPIEPFGQPNQSLSLQKGLIHLGNDFYDGELNQGFKKKAQGLVWQTSFNLANCPPLLILKYNSRGLEATYCSINGHLFPLTSNRYNNNGGELEVKLPSSYFQIGSNAIKIESGTNNSGDRDDCELWNIRLLY